MSLTIDRAHLPQPVVDDGTRREFIAGGLTLAALLAGCGDERAPGDETRAVRHALGTTRVPTAPKRVLVTDPQTLGMVIALGVIPAGALPIYPTREEPGPFPAWLKEKGIKPVGEYGVLDPEVIAAFGPDLIVGTKSLLAEPYDTMRRIAPTVAFDNPPEWQTKTLPNWARALGREDVVDDVLAAYRGRVKEVAAAIPRARETTVSIIAVFPDGTIYLDGVESPGGLVARDVGLPRPASQRFTRAENPNPAISIEQLRRVHADVILVRVVDQRTWDTVRSSALWRQLPAVRSGRVFRVAGSGWADYGPGAAGLALDDLARFLA